MQNLPLLNLTISVVLLLSVKLCSNGIVPMNISTSVKM